MQQTIAVTTRSRVQPFWSGKVVEPLMKLSQLAPDSPDAPWTGFALINHGAAANSLHHEVASVIAHLDDLGDGVAVSPDELHDLSFTCHRPAMARPPQNLSSTVFEDVGIST
jgi:hypothetical protein